MTSFQLAFSLVDIPAVLGHYINKSPSIFMLLGHDKEDCLDVFLLRLSGMERESLPDSGPQYLFLWCAATPLSLGVEGLQKSNRVE